MSGCLKQSLAWSELAALSHSLVEQVSLTELSRFVEALAHDQPDDTVVDVTLGPRVDPAGVLFVVGELRAEVLTPCQRCLKRVHLVMEESFEWRIGQESSDSVVLLDWLEDEMLLSLPQYVVHDNVRANQQCDETMIDRYSPDQDLRDQKSSKERDSAETTRPFEVLKDLLPKN